MKGKGEGVLHRRRNPSSSPKGAGDAVKVLNSAKELIEEEMLQSAMEDINGDVFENENYISKSLAIGSGKLTMITEVLFSYLWWSVFQAMPGIVWFYPLCLMEISGYEVFGVMWFSPVLMKFSFVRNFVTSPCGLMLTRMFTMIGVGSFLTSSTIVRLILASVGNFFALLCFAGMLWDKAKIDRYRHGYLHMLGYLLYLAVRIWGSSFNYIFMNTHLNIVGVGVGVVASVVLYVNDVRSPIITSQPLPEDSRNDVNGSNETSEPDGGVAKSSSALSESSGSGTDSGTGPGTGSGTDSGSDSGTIPGSPPVPGLVATGVAFGALVFLTSFLFGETSIICRWCVAPHPFPGPQPHPWGMATMAALTMGFVFFGNQVDLLTSFPWLSVGVVFFAILYYGETFMAFFGGLILGVYVASLWPLLLKRIVAFPPHRIFLVVMGTYFFYMVLSVWVVAYNFVPGGVYTRERTDAMVFMLILCCGLGTCSFSQDRVESKASEKLQVKRERALTVNFFGRVFRRLSTIVEDSENEALEEIALVQQVLYKEQLLSEGKEMGNFHRKFLKGTVIILVFAVLGYAWRYQPHYPAPFKERPRVFSAGIWAFHFGYDNQGWPSMERAAQFIENSEVDVIGLLETDANRPYIGSHDIASWLGERLHMYTDYGPGSKDHTWGTLLLSKYPIVQSRHHLLPSPEGEIAPAILATVNISGHLVDFYAVHFGNDQDDLDRKLQAKTTVEILNNSTNPLVVLSYVTSRPGSRDYNTITTAVKDLDPSDGSRFCEYVFYKNLTRLGYARISHGGLSDTEMQVGKFMIKDPPSSTDWPHVTTDPTEVPSWMHFPSKFGAHRYGHSWNESRHSYHMNTPKYFKIHG